MNRYVTKSVMYLAIWLLLAGIGLSDSICDYPDEMVGPDMTARQYCRKMNRLNLLMVIPGAVASYFLLIIPPTSRMKPIDKFYRTIIRGWREPWPVKGDPPSDQALFGLQVLFHTVWMLSDFRYPSIVMGATSTAFMITYPIIPVVAMVFENKRSIFLSPWGWFWTIYWLGGLLLNVFPRLNWSTKGVDALRDVKLWSLLLSRLHDARVFASIPVATAANIVFLFVLGIVLMLRPVDEPVPVRGYVDPTTRMIRITSMQSPKESGVSRSNAIDETVDPTADEAVYVHEMSDQAYALQGSSGRFVGYYGPERLNLSVVGYGFILLSVILFLTFVQRNNDDLDSGTNLRALTALRPALFVTVTASVALSFSSDRPRSTQRGLLIAATYCSTWLLILAGVIELP